MDGKTIRKAITEANSLLAVLQGTMSLEGQGLEKKSLRQIKRRMIYRLLGTERSRAIEALDESLPEMELLIRWAEENKPDRSCFDEDQDLF